MKTTIVKGTRDFLPNEVALRDYMQNNILKAYQTNGFNRISTPILEDIENLNKSEGGENLNLIFKVLKRGDKLKNSFEKGQMNELSDMGLRYDLTLPLSRYFANNKEKLMLPFKCIQIDKVYRAERPQRGRDREFIQCDIDIIGSTSLNSEIELIDVTAKALISLCINDFTIKINDRHKEADKYRTNFNVDLYEIPKKLGKFLDKLTLDGYYGYIIYGDGHEMKRLK